MIAEQHLLNADAVFHAVMNENPDNDYSKSTARYLYSLYMRWGKKGRLAEQYKKILNQHALGIAISNDTYSQNTPKYQHNGVTRS